MFNLPVYVETLRKEVRLLRIHNQQLQRIYGLSSGKISQLKEEIKRLKDEQRRLKRENRRLEKEQERLNREIEKLTKTNNRYRISLFDHGNFKQEPDREKKPNGGQIGHKDTNKDRQRNYNSFTRQRVHAETCGTCGRRLSRVSSVKKKTLIDIQINTETLQVILESERQWCGNCHKEVRANHPQSLPFTEYGINTFMTVMYLRFKGKQSEQTIAAMLHGLFGLQISASGIGTLLNQAKVYLQERYNKLKQAVRDGEIMYNDETGWQVRGKSAWIWIMTNNDKTVYIAAESRGRGIMEEIYGNSSAYSMHDGYAGYTNTVPVDKQLYCWAHYLRFVYEETVTAPEDSIESRIKKRLVMLYRTIRAHSEYTKQQKEIILTGEINNLLTVKAENQTLKNILGRLRMQKDGLIRSLLMTADGTNNLAERELRPLVINRTISYGSGSYGGMEKTAILASITQTITRDKKTPYFPTLKSYLQKSLRKKYPQYKHIPLFDT